MTNKSVQTHARTFKIGKFTSVKSNIREQSFFFLITVPLSLSTITTSLDTRSLLSMKRTEMQELKDNTTPTP